MKGRHAEWDFKLDRMMFLGKYKVTGKVLILPITGEGDANITLSKSLKRLSGHCRNVWDLILNTILKMFYFLAGLEFSFIYDWDLVRRNGFDYVKITNTTLPYHISSMHINLENLFNGDKLLGK